MALSLLPLGTLGAVESNGVVTFGLWLPWVSAADGNAVSVKIIHEADQFLQDVPPIEFPLTHSVQPPYGDFWSVTVPIAGTPSPILGSAWGSPGRYVYRYTIVNPNVGSLDWIVDPFAREYGVGKLSAFTLGYQPYVWSTAEANWHTPALADLVLYEINIAELAGDFERTRHLMAYLSDLGVNAVEVMPLSNSGVPIDWGYLPIGYFGVDERFGRRSDFQQIVDIAHQHGIAVVVDVVYGHTGVDFPYYDAYTRLQYRENPFMGPFAKDYFSNFGKSTDFERQLPRDYFFSVNHHWLDVYHVDGFRYDCVPNWWDGPLGVGYASLVYETYQLAKAKIAQGDLYWQRFGGEPGEALTLVQMAEQLEDPEGVLRMTYSNSTWQNRTFDAARGVARGNRSRLSELGLSLGLFGYPEQENSNGDAIPKTLTDEGLLLYERSRSILEQIRDAEAEVASRGGVARGLLKVGAPSDFGRRHVGRILALFTAQHPGLEAHLVLSDAGLENQADACDVVLRFGLPNDPGMVARKMAMTTRILCAAPSYFTRRG